MISTGIIAAAFLGMRHGVDPDHLAAIDNLTRNAIDTQPRASTFTGALFAGGHSAMVLLIAALLGYFGVRAGAAHSTLETAGTWLSIAILFVMAAANVRRLIARRGAMSLRSRLFARIVGSRHGALAAVPIGFLFGLGFETSSQIAAYAVATSAGLGGAVLIGCAFCVGMMVTDTADSLLVNRAVRGTDARASTRVWLWTLTLAALAIAIVETAQALGLALPVPDSVLSASLVGLIAAVFACVAVRSRLHPSRAT